MQRMDGEIPDGGRERPDQIKDRYLSPSPSQGGKRSQVPPPLQK